MLLYLSPLKYYQTLNKLLYSNRKEQLCFQLQWHALNFFFFLSRGREWKIDWKIRIKWALGGQIARSSSLGQFPTCWGFWWLYWCQWALVYLCAQSGHVWLCCFDISMMWHGAMSCKPLTHFLCGPCDTQQKFCLGGK